MTKLPLFDRVLRQDFVRFLRARPELRATPIEARNIAAMQFADAEGRIVAQATYHRGLSPLYEIAEDARKAGKLCEVKGKDESDAS